MTDPRLTDERLLPCPFCGGPAFSGSTLDDQYYAMCADDGCFGMVAYLPSMSEAIAAWNRRTTSVDVEAWIEGIDSAPYASTVLATYWSEEHAEWIVQIFVAERPTAPFTHWQYVTRPGEALSQPLAGSGDGEAVAWRVKDYADGWLLCHTEEVAINEAENGNLIQPLYLRPSVVAVSEETLATVRNDALEEAAAAATKHGVSVSNTPSTQACARNIAAVIRALKSSSLDTQGDGAMKAWMSINMPDTVAAWRKLWFSWHMMRAERLISKAGDHYAKAGELNFALEAYDLVLQSAMRLDKPEVQP